MTEYLSRLASAEFIYPEVLWALLAVPLLLGLSLLRIRGRVVAHIFRSLAFALLIVAAAGPTSTETSSTEELAALFDVSYSIGKRAQGALAQELATFVGEKGGTLNLRPFGRSPGKETSTIDASMDSEDILAEIKRISDGIDTGQTNLGDAISATVSQSASSSVLLLTDGFETAGNARQAARAAAGKGVRVFPLVPGEEVFQREKLVISSLHAPVTARSGDKAEVRVSVKNSFSQDMRGELQIWLDKEKLFSQQVRFPAEQEKLVKLDSAALKGGLHRLRAVLKPLGSNSGEDVTVERHRWISVKEKDKLLLISGSKQDERVLKELIRLKGYGLNDIVADGKKDIPLKFDSYSSVILNNVAKRQLPKQFLPALKKFVSEGGGSLLLGGDRSFGLGEYIKTPLEEISPLKFVPPQTKKRRLTVAVLLVMDKSGSMAHQNKIVAAKAAAKQSIESLKDEDYVGVIGFDHAPFVIIDLKRVGEVKHQADRRLRNLTAAGKTNLLPALAAARQKLKNASASRKHIIVLSDGKIPLASDVYVEEINRLRSQGVSVSAVALGLEADVPFLKLLAKYGKGAFYHTLDPSRLPQIFVHDIKVSTGERTMQENKEFPIGLGPSGVLTTDINRYPPLLGFVETLPKKGSSLELITRRGKKIHPILASWKYKKGKVIAFTSDANGRWSLPWLKWAKFPNFWADMIDAIKDRSGKRGNDVDFDLRYRVNRGAVLLDLAIFDDKLRAQSSPKISARILEPGGEPKDVVFRPIKKGRFEAIIDNGRPGDYRIDISYGDLKLPTLALTLGGEAFGETPGRGLNMSSLEEIAYLSGGLINPATTQVQGKKRTAEKVEHLFPPLVLLALLLVLLDVYTRETNTLPFLKRPSHPLSLQNEQTKPQGTYEPTRKAG